MAMVLPTGRWLYDRLVFARVPPWEGNVGRCRIGRVNLRPRSPPGFRGFGQDGSFRVWSPAIPSFEAMHVVKKNMVTLYTIFGKHRSGTRWEGT